MKSQNDRRRPSGMPPPRAPIRQPRVVEDPDNAPFPTRQLTILAICRFSEPIAFNSILAYSYVMVRDLNGGDDTNASFYAGLLVSAYAVAEAMTAMLWGIVSDHYGRKPVVLIGLCGVALSSLIFGLAKHYWVALLARFVGGSLNGNVAVMQTMMAEMVKNPAHEPRAYAVQPFVWILGSIIGSAIGGYLVEPATFYPDYFSKDGLFGRYPYLLPNLFAVVVISLAVIQGIFLLEETNPLTEEPESTEADDVVDERTPLRRPRQRRSIMDMRNPSRSRTRSIVESIREVASHPRDLAFMEDSLPAPMDQRFDLRRSSFGTIHSIKVPGFLEHERRPFLIPPVTPPRKTFNFTVVMLIISLVLIAYHQMAFCAIIPIYLLDNPGVPSGLDLIGGLNYSVHDVGSFMAINGFIALGIQAIIFPIVVENVGVWWSFISCVVLYPVPYIMIPFLSMLSPNLIAPGVYFILFLQNLFGIIAVPCALILLKNAIPSPLVLGRVNGLAMSACCGARTISPPLVGVIYSVGGSAAAWFSCAGFAIISAVQLIWIPRERVGEVHVETVFKHQGDTDSVIAD